MEARFFRSQAAEVTGTAERMFLLAMAERLERRADASMYEG
jgi:hypothetical protein